MANAKFVKTAAAVALGTSVVATAVAPSASAATTYKIKSGKLVNATTGKVVKGYKTYKSVLYKDGKKYTGLRSGKYYKNGVLTSGTYKGIKYQKGLKFTGISSSDGKYYKNGVVGTGTYKDVKYKKGVKFTGVSTNGKYYKNGVLGTGTYENVKYKNGVEFTGVSTNGKYYENGVVATGVKTVDDVVYVDGVKDEVAPEITAEDQTVAYEAKDVDVLAFAKVEDNSKEEIKATATITFDGKEVPAIDTTKAGEYTVTYAAKDANGNEATKEIKVTVAEPAVAEVETVEAISATQVKVTFTKEVDPKKVNDEATGKVITDNIKFTPVSSSAAVTVASAKVDGKTVVYTLSDKIEGEYTVEIDNLQTPKEEKIARYVKVINFAADTTAPTITGTERISATQVKVNFSEPVQNTGSITAKYADGTEIKGFKTPTIAKGDTSVTFDLSDKDITVDKDIVVTFNGLQDIKGNLINPQPATATIKKEEADKVAPTLTAVTQTGAKTFSVKFDKAIDEATFTAAPATSVTLSPENTVTAIEKVTDTEYKVTTTNALDGIVTVNVTGSKVKNLDGTEATATLSKLVTFAKDTVAPKATAQAVTKAGVQYLQLTFDKDVVLVGDKQVKIEGTSTKDYIETAISSGVTATAAYADETGKDKKVVLVPLDALSVEGAEYNVTISNVSETNGITNEADTAMETATAKFVRVTDKPETPAEENDKVYTSFTATQGATADEVKLTFALEANTKLDGATATNAANYTVAGAVVESAKLTAVDTDANTQVVTLTLAKNSSTFDGTRNVTVQNVKVANSTKVKPATTVVSGSLYENVRSQLKSASITGANAITLEFDEAVTANANAFDVKVGGEKVAATTSTTAGEKVVITLTTPLTTADLAKAITVESAKDVDGKVDTSKFIVKDANGNLLEDFAAKTATLAQ